MARATRTSIRRWGAALLPALLTIGLLALPAAAAAGPDPAAPTALAADANMALAEVSITDGGFVPAHLSVRPGQAVHWVNTSSVNRRVVADGGAFDSGTMKPGDGFYVLLPVTGTYPYRTPDGGFGGSVTMRAPGGTIGGPGTDPVSSHIPDGIPVDEPGSFGMHPTLTAITSRTRLLVSFTPTATVAQANAALAAAGMGAAGGLPAERLVLAELLTDDGTFAPLLAALDTLRANAAVAVAALDFAVAEQQVPARTEDALATGTYPWTWSTYDPTTGEPVGLDANWGLEASRFPEAWNLLDPLLERTPDPRSRTTVLDGGFALAHPDLDLRQHVGADALCIADGVCTEAAVAEHGTHVAGIIGARYDNTSGGRTVGVSGGNPVGEVSAVAWGSMSQRVSGLGGVLGFFEVASMASSVALFDAIITAAGTPALPDMHVINYSATSMVLARNSDKTFTWWDTYRTGPRCGPGTNDDATGSDVCTPNNHDGWLREFRAAASLLMPVAERAAAKDILIVAAAGNDGQFCHPVWGGPTPASVCQLEAPKRVEWAHIAATWASTGHTGKSPVLVVENLAVGAVTPELDATSDVFGNISAPGTDILSTVAGVEGAYVGQTYARMTGTSMAAPHVSALASWLWAIDPTLTYTEVRDAITDFAVVTPPNFATARRIDAFAATLSLPGAARMLVDVNDPSLDGNRRAVLDATGNVVAADETLHEFRANRHSQPDGVIGMRDFRRFRDAWLVACTLTSTVRGASGAASVADELTITQGTTPNIKLDLNWDGCVDSSLWERANPTPSCPQGESVRPRFDFNGDNVIDVDRDAIVPLLANGQPASSAAAGTPMDDLDVLASQWPTPTPADPADPAEGRSASDLRALLTSGDLTILADDFLAAGATDVTIEIDAGGAPQPTRHLTDHHGIVASAPSGTPLQVRATATIGNTRLVSPTVTVGPLQPGEDVRVDLCAAHVELTPDRGYLPANGETSTTVTATVKSCGAPVPAGAAITFALTPSGDGHARLDAVPTVLDANGQARVRVVAGTTEAEYGLRASVEVGGGDPAVGFVEIPVGAVRYVHYVWRQEVPSWSQSGSTRWPGAPADMPDCTLAGVERCIDSWVLGAPEGVVDHLDREGHLDGGGSTLFLSETVGTDWNQSVSTTHLSDPDNADARFNVKSALWRVKPSEATRYTDHEVPAVTLTESSRGAELTGFQALAALGYLHDASTQLIDGDTIEQPEVLPFAQHDLLLVPRTDGIRYSDTWNGPIRFARASDGSLATYDYCGSETRDLTTAPGYLVSTPSDWIPGASELGRDPVFDPGDIPLTVGPGSMTLRWRFAAVVTDSPERPTSLALPACTAPQPPTADFAVDPATAGEGRWVSFTDLSTDPEGDITTRAWDFGDGQTTATQDTRHRFADDGTFTVTLVVTDAGGRTASTTRTVVITNLAPEANVEDASAPAGHAVQVPVAFADPGDTDNTSLHVRLTVDGAVVYEQTTKGTALNVSVPGLAVGIHAALLEVRDPDGATATDTARLVVREGPPPPEVPHPGTPTCVASVSLDAEEMAFLTELNAHRARNGLDPVRVSPALTRAAEGHVADMLGHPEVVHIGTDGRNWHERALAAGYPADSATGENVARGMLAGRMAYVAWHSSPPHNANMLNPDWEVVGIARATTASIPWATTYGTVDDCRPATATIAPQAAALAAAPHDHDGDEQDLGELGSVAPGAPAPRSELAPALAAEASAPAGAVDVRAVEGDAAPAPDGSEERSAPGPTGLASMPALAGAAPTGTTPVPAFRLSPDRPVPGGPTAFVHRTLRLNGASDLRLTMWQQLEGRSGNLAYPDYACGNVSIDISCGAPFPWGGAVTFAVNGTDGGAPFSFAVGRTIDPAGAVVTITSTLVGPADSDVRVSATATSAVDGLTLIDEHAVDGLTLRFTLGGTSVLSRSGVVYLHTPATPGPHALLVELVGTSRWATTAMSAPFTVEAVAPGSGTVTPRVGDSAKAKPAATVAMVPVAVAIRGTDVFVADGQADQIKRIDTAATPPTAVVIAGDGTPGAGGDGGPATSAQLDLPSGYTPELERAGLAVDADGNVYVADTGNHRVRRIGTDGTIATVVGTGTAGGAGLGGPAVAAQLDRPRGLAFDTLGRLWIADYGNGRVVRLEADGTLAAVGGAMPFVSGMAAAPSGAMVVARLGDQTVWSLDPATGAATRIAGDSVYGSTAAGRPALSTWLDGLVDVAVSPDGVVHVVTRHLLRKWGADGIVRDEAGSITGTFGEPRGLFDGDGTATVQHLSIPVGVAYDAQGRAWLADRGNHRLRRVSGSSLATIAGNGSCCVGGQRSTTLGAADAVALARPGGIGVRLGGDLLVVDQANRTAYQVPALTSVLQRLTGIDTPVCRCGENVFTNVAPDMRFMGPLTDAAPGAGGRAYVAQAGLGGDGGYVYAVDPSGVSNVPPMLTVVAGSGNRGAAGDGGPALDADLAEPYGITVAADGSVYVADRGTSRIRRFTPGGTMTRVAATADLDAPEDVLVAADGTLTIADTGHHRVLRVAPDGTVTVLAGTGTAGYAGDGGSATAARLDSPSDLAVDGRGTVFVADRGNHRVRAILPDGRIVTVAGTGQASGRAVDGARPSDTPFRSPDGLGLDGRDLLVSTGPRIVSFSTPAGPTVYVSDPTVTEGTGSGTTTATFTLSLVEPAATALSVAWATQAGSAADGADFTAASGTASFAAGTVTATVSVAVTRDSVLEPSEWFSLVLSDPTGGLQLGDAEARATILDDDVAGPMPSVSVTGTRVTEGTGATPTAAAVTVTLSAPTAGAVTVAYATRPGTATAPADFVARTGWVTIAAGSTTTSIPLEVVADDVEEPQERFTVELTGAAGATLGTPTTAEVIIDDDDAAPPPPPVTLSVDDVSITEGDSGTKVATFTVSLSRAATTSVSFRWATGGGTATAGTDYTAVASTLVTVPAGATQQTLAVTIKGDTTVEPDETFEVTLSSPTGATLADAVGTGTILNDDAAPAPITLSVSDVSVTEGNSGTKVAAFTVSLSRVASTSVSFRWVTGGGTATAGSDYTRIYGTTVTIPAGATRRTLNVTIKGDTTVEPDETFEVTLSSPTGATLADAVGIGTILNDDSPPAPLPTATVVGPGPVIEGTSTSGTATAVFTVRLSASAAGPVSVAYATTAGTASAGSDFTATSGTLTFAPGETQRTVAVPVVSDAVDEPDETFSLALSAPTGATLGSPSSASATIVDDDEAQVTPSLTINDRTVAEGNSGTKTVTLTIRLSAARTTATTVRWATAGGTATAGSDFTAASGTATIAAGATTTTVSVLVRGDRTKEPNEVFTVRLTSPSGATIADNIGRVTITNDD